MKYLIVVDMQNDFIDGALGTPEAQKITPLVKKRIEEFCGEVIFTRDTHFENYLETSEGKRLPVKHCIKDTEGWQIEKSLQPYAKKIYDKITFGSPELARDLEKINRENKIESITLVGLCTDICVISNAMLIKAHLPEAEITVDGTCSAGVTPSSHKNALEAMKMCQINIIE